MVAVESGALILVRISASYDKQPHGSVIPVDADLDSGKSCSRMNSDTGVVDYSAARFCGGSFGARTFNPDLSDTSNPSNTGSNPPVSVRVEAPPFS
jgi:hypothetical protein